MLPPLMTGGGNYTSKPSSAEAVTLCSSTHSLGKLEDVENKLFHLNPVRLFRADELTRRVHVRDLLLGHVVLQPRLVLPEAHTDASLSSSGMSWMEILSHSLHDVPEEGEGEEVVGHVSGVKHEPPVGAALLGGRQGDLTVLHHLIAPVHLTDNAHRLRGIGFLHHLENQNTCEEAAWLKQMKSAELNTC